MGVPIPTKRLMVRLTADEAERLKALARAERRHPADQAGLILSDALRNREPGAGDASVPHER